MVRLLSELVRLNRMLTARPSVGPPAYDSRIDLGDSTHNLDTLRELRILLKRLCLKW